MTRKRTGVVYPWQLQPLMWSFKFFQDWILTILLYVHLPRYSKCCQDVAGMVCCSQVIWFKDTHTHIEWPLAIPPVVNCKFTQVNNIHTLKYKVLSRDGCVCVKGEGMVGASMESQPLHQCYHGNHCRVLHSKSGSMYIIPRVCSL